MQAHRKVTRSEILQMEQNGCSSTDWGQVFVKEGFDPQHVRNSRFSGTIRLGRFEKEFSLPGGLCKQSGLNRAVLQNCDVGGDVVIEDVQNYIDNYTIGDDCSIHNVDEILVDGLTASR